MSKIACQLVIVVETIMALLIGISTTYIANAQTYTPKITSKSPLIILLDNSGSMGCAGKTDKDKCSLDIETPYKIDVVKNAIRNRINQTDLVSTKIGLIEFGDYKSYGLKNEQHCQAIKSLVPVGSNNKNDLVSKLNQINANSYGATPITYALDDTVTNLEMKGLLPARVLLITDGNPNCNEQFVYKHLCRLIDSLAVSKIDLKIDILGYQANEQDDEFLTCAEKHPQMITYWGSSNSPHELEKKVSQVIVIPDQNNSSNLVFFDKGFWQGIVSGFIVAILTATITWFWSQRFFTRKIRAAPKQYALELESLIKRARRGGPDNAVVNARAIVAARDSLRHSLTNISQNLNSEIDQLAHEITQIQASKLEISEKNAQIYATIEVLNSVWDSKKLQISVEIRKILAELGLDIDSA